MFGKLEKSDLAIIEAYMLKNSKTAIYLKQPIEQFKNGSLQGSLYGYVNEQSLLGLFYFSNKRSLILHFSDERVLGNLNLLKAFKHHAPKYVKGEFGNMQSFYKIICRAVNHIHEDISILMGYGGSEAIELSPIPYKIEDDAPMDHSSIGENIKFFLKVEQVFGRNVKSVQEIQKTLEDLVIQGHYCFVKDGDDIIAQGIIEEETSDMMIIGGIYVDPRYRKQALGYHISRRLTAKGIEKQKSVYLFVLKGNTTAREMYLKIGYDELATFSIFTID